MGSSGIGFRVAGNLCWLTGQHRGDQINKIRFGSTGSWINEQIPELPRGRVQRDDPWLLFP